MACKVRETSPLVWLADKIAPIGIVYAHKERANSTWPTLVRLITMIAAFCLICMMTFRVLSAQEPQLKYEIPSEKLNCLVENREKYIDLPRAIILFTPELCPLVGHEEAAYLAQNSGDNGKKTPRLMMRKSEFSCLVAKIEAFLEEHAQTSPAGELVAFTLDCS